VCNTWDDEEIVWLFDSNLEYVPRTDNMLVQISENCAVKFNVSF
jgi:hypothetical protein